MRVFPYPGTNVAVCRAEEDDHHEPMPRRAEALIERRRLEAERRRELRRIRREAILQLCVVFAVTVPVIVSLLPRDEPVVLGREHVRMLPPAHAAASPEPDPGVADAPTAEQPGTVSISVSGHDVAGHPAPRSVRRTASRHGGSGISRWVAHECAGVAELVRRHGMPEWMTTVAWRESRCQHAVTNFNRRTADRSYGLFQINVLGDLWKESRERCGLAHPEELLNPHVNVSCAAALYRAYGYQPWDSGRYFSR